MLQRAFLDSSVGKTLEILTDQLGREELLADWRGCSGVSYAEGTQNCCLSVPKKSQSAENRRVSNRKMQLQVFRVPQKEVQKGFDHFFLFGH